MSSLPLWDKLIAGEGCPFCLPRADVNEYSFKIEDLGVSTLYLDRNQTYRGYCILQFNKRHVTGIEHLSADEYQAFTADLHRAARAVFNATAPDHMNYSTLGNVIPHLHYHIIPRYRGEERWGAPVWTSKLEDMRHTILSDAEYESLIAGIRAGLGKTDF